MFYLFNDSLLYTVCNPLHTWSEMLVADGACLGGRAEHRLPAAAEKEV